MNILIIGGGGREYAIGLRLREDKNVLNLYFAPGNGATKALGKNLDLKDFNELALFAKNNDVALTVVGAEEPLTKGIVDIFKVQGLAIFGPSAAAAKLEGSKAYMKDFLARNHIKTAKFLSSDDLSEISKFIDTLNGRVVVKADGLCAGKGVIIANSKDEAKKAAADMLSGESFGEAGKRVVVEEFLEGFELSFFAICDGENFVSLPVAQDHKKLLDGDLGPNTGGMGAYAPAPVAPPALVAEVQRTVLEPTIRAMEQEGRLYKGCLYAGLMVTAEGAKVVEFNCRFGDPETEVVLPLLLGDLVEIMLACVDGSLAEVEIPWSKGAAVTVVLAAGGYPKAYEKGAEITGLAEAEAEGCLVFHAGTAAKDGVIVTAGGRVLNIVAEAADIKTAVEKAYRGVDRVHFKDAFCRRDIAHRALERMK